MIKNVLMRQIFISIGCVIGAAVCILIYIWLSGEKYGVLFSYYPSCALVFGILNIGILLFSIWITIWPGKWKSILLFVITLIISLITLTSAIICLTSWN